jgi:hypothetical protein
VSLPANAELVSEITATVHAVLEPYGLVRAESGLIRPTVWTGESDAPDRGRHVRPTGTGRNRWITRWKAALNAFELTFEGRLSAARI